MSSEENNKNTNEDSEDDNEPELSFLDSIFVVFVIAVVFFLLKGCFSAVFLSSAADELKDKIENELDSGKPSFGLTFTASVATTTSLGYEIKDYDVSTEEEVSVRHDGRSLKAGIVKVEIDYVNRGEGKYQEGCYYIAAIFDSEFDVWRNVKTVRCNRKHEINTWKIQNKAR